MLKVGIDARVGGGWSGGVEMVVIGLAQGFAALDDGSEEYLFFASPGRNEWLRPYLGANSRIVPARAAKPAGVLRRVSYGLQKLQDIIRARKVVRRLSVPQGVEGSNGRVEAVGVDVMHFVLQKAFATEIPYIYHPHDLQHVHFPEFFTPQEAAERDRIYRYFCKNAALVATVSSWVKSDVMAQYGIAENKVAVVPFAPPNLGYGKPDNTDIARTIANFNLPDEFAFYSAQTWQHKNHIRLIEAVARIRDGGGPLIPLVFSGRMNAHHAAIAARVDQLNLRASVHFLGYVSALELQVLYARARCLVVPSLHEAASFPIWEAFHAGTPVACSSVTSLPRQVGDAGLLFDPENLDDIALKLRRIWEDADLRRALSQRGKARVSELTWERSCRKFRAHYRCLAGCELSPEDQSLINVPALI